MVTAPPLSSLGNGSPTLEGHAEQIRSSISDVMGADSASDESGGAVAVTSEDAGAPQGQSSVGAAKTNAGSRPSVSTRRGPTVHRYNLGTWSTYHAARIAARTIANATSHQD